MDQFDRAQELEALYRQQALDNHRRKIGAAESLTHCIDCGEEIPQKRREVVPGCRRCRNCAEEYERKERGNT